MKLTDFLCALKTRLTTKTIAKERRRYRPMVELLEDRVTPATLPTGFQESAVAAGISGGTAMEIASDGRIWVLEQGGDVEVFHAGSNTSFTALDIPAAAINSAGERGLLGIAFDPTYNIGDAAPDFVYLYYTSTAAPNPHNRISRFTVDNTNPDQPTLGSELVVFDLNSLGSATTHNGGAIHFGPDGKLYIAVGDNANGANAQSLTTLHGKMLRINADGTIPADNPFVSQTTGINQAIWARGLRNPFTFAFQPGTGRMHINDVGQNTWEEINVGAAGANYGWPTTEGDFNQSPFPNFTRPFFSYSHGSGMFQGFAITGGAFYNPSNPGFRSFPLSFEGDYFFADFVNDWINVIDIRTRAVTRFATNTPGTVDLRVEPDGSLLYLARDSGSVFRVIYTAAITVTTTADEDNGSVNGVSLREAIKAANMTAAADTIHFNIPGAGPHTIALTSPLPALTSQVAIGGHTQPGIILDGSGAGAGANGLVLKAAGSLVRGLTINNFQGNGILVFGANSAVEGCRIGTDVDGAIAAPNLLHGILIAGTASGVRIGGTTAAAGNIISGNGLAGVAIQGASVKNNVVQGNRIGTDILGGTALGNGLVGVLISGGADANIIGGTMPTTRNIISGNAGAGVEISGAGTTGNLVVGNFIGLDILGSSQVGNAGDGVVIKTGAASNRVGGTATARNIISGNANGVNISGAGTTGNVISANYIGTDSSGAGAIGNAAAGVRITAAGNTVGGMTAGMGNVISGNASGIVISGAGANANIVQGNFIGANAAGTSALANTAEGVTLALGAKNNIIGGTMPAARNVISGNGTSGVLISGLDTTGNMVQGNFIGPDVTGNLDLGNVQNGVRIVLGAMNNTIGGVVAAARNVISGNNGNGVHIEGAPNNRVQGNFIGTNAAGAASLPNSSGVTILSAANNTIGGTMTAARNVISGNTSNGVRISGLGATGNMVQGNFIGTNAAGTGDLGNGLSGVAILDAAAANTIGGTLAAARNIISGNDGSGVRISDAGAALNVVQGNFIGLDVNGVSPLGNSLSGVFITNNAANNRIGGTLAGAGNTIAHNSGDGVLIGSDPANGFNDPAGNGNSVQGNRIFSNAGQGIDLGANDGPTPNDTDDVDTGPNGLLNTPVLTSAFLDGVNLILTGFINTSLFTAWRIEFFVSPPSGQGQTMLGALSGNTDDSTKESFATVLTVPATVLAGHKLTATLTDGLGNTSEFSIPLTIE